MEARQGDPEIIAYLPVEPIRTPVTFITEEKGIPRMKSRRPEVLFCMSCEEPDALRKTIGLLEGLPGVVNRYIQMFPVIHATAPKISVFQGKAQGADQMQPGPREGTQASNISRVLRDFGLKKDDVQIRTHCARCGA